MFGAAHPLSPQPQSQSAPASLIPDKEGGRTWSQSARAARLEAEENIHSIFEGAWNQKAESVRVEAASGLSRLRSSDQYLHA